MKHQSVRLSLYWDSTRAVLCTQGRDQYVSFSALADTWHPFSVLSSYADAETSEAVIPMNRLESLRTCLLSLREQLQRIQRVSDQYEHIRLDIDEFILALQFGDCRQDVQIVRYLRGGSSLFRQPASSVTVLDGGWVCEGNRTWPLLPSCAEEISKWIAQDMIPAEQVLDFVKNGIPALKANGMIVFSDIASVSSVPYIKYAVKRTPDGLLCLSPLPALPDAAPDFALPGYKLCKTILHPLPPSALFRLAKSAENGKLIIDSGDSAALLSQFSAFLAGDLSFLESSLKIVPRPYTWKLKLCPVITNGIGRAMAQPIACFGSQEVPAEKIHDAIAQNLPYLQLTNGMVKRDDLISMEQALLNEKVSPAPFPATAEDVLFPSEDSKLWNHVERATEPTWFREGPPPLVARKHLEFLTSWGISGGIEGGYEALIAYGFPFLDALTDAFPSCLPLVIAEDSLADALESYRERSRFCILSLSSFLHMPHPGASADLLLLAEPELASPKMLQRLVSVLDSFTCPVLFFTGTLNLMDDLHLNFYHGFFHTTDLRKLSVYLRNIRKEIFPGTCSTSNRSFAVRDKDSSSSFFEEVLSFKSPVRNVSDKRPPKVAGRDRKLSLFLQQMREKADYVPISTPLPCKAPYSPDSYADLNPSQLEYYFFLRSKWRTGEYPSNVDGGFYNLYIFELLSLVGVKDAREAYSALLRLWKSISKEHYSLSYHLSDWISDFVILHPEADSLPGYISKAPILSFRMIDYLLTQSGNRNNPQPFPRLPLSVLTEYGGYDITQSRLYTQNEAARSLIDSKFPDLFCFFDEKTYQKSQKRLAFLCNTRLEEISVSPFADAFVERPPAYIMNLRSFRRSRKFCQTLYSILRYGENLLRKHFKVSGRLQGIHLDEDQKAWIDEYIASLLTPSKSKQPPAPAPVTISLDLEQIALSRRNADDARDALRATLPEDDLWEDRPDVPDSAEVSSPEPESEAVPSADDPWQRFLSSCDSDALEAALNGSMPAYSKTVHRMPDDLQDQINDLFMDIFGDLLLEDYTVLEDWCEELSSRLKGAAHVR